MTIFFPLFGKIKSFYCTLQLSLLVMQMCARANIIAKLTIRKCLSSMPSTKNRQDGIIANAMLFQFVCCLKYRAYTIKYASSRVALAIRYATKCCAKATFFVKVLFGYLYFGKFAMLKNVDYYCSSNSVMKKEINSYATKASIFGILSIALPIPAFIIVSFLLIFLITAEGVYMTTLVGMLIAGFIGLVFGILSRLNVNKGVGVYDDLLNESNGDAIDEKELYKKFADKYFNGDLSLPEKYLKKIRRGYVLSRFGIVLGIVFLFMSTISLVVILSV